MIYVKRILDGAVAGLYTYEYTPDLSGDETVTEITADEYAALLAELRATQPQPDPSDEITSAAALKILLGEENDE